MESLKETGMVKAGLAVFVSVAVTLGLIVQLYIRFGPVELSVGFKVKGPQALTGKLKLAVGLLKTVMF